MMLLVQPQRTTRREEKIVELVFPIGKDYMIGWFHAMILYFPVRVLLCARPRCVAHIHHDHFQNFVIERKSPRNNRHIDKSYDAVVVSSDLDTSHHTATNSPHFYNRRLSQSHKIRKYNIVLSSVITP